MGAPFEQQMDTLKHDPEDRSVHSGSSAFGSVYIFWNQRRRLPSTLAFSNSNSQILKPPPTLSFKSGFGSAITALGDIDHDGVDGMFSSYLLEMFKFFYFKIFSELRAVNCNFCFDSFRMQDK